MSKSSTKYIFVSGGVISAVGKGISASSIALLLQNRGFKVSPLKCENNLNVDFGTVNPIEHGDPFLCHDGLEGDMDLGNYERFLGKEVGQPNFITMGQLYLSVINRERRMGYNGEDVEPIPHVVNEILDSIKKLKELDNPDFVIVELGGTVGEYENNNGLYYEAARILAMTEPVAHVHVTYVPIPPHVGEPKTKPAQFGLHGLMSMGIVPNFIIIRSQIPIDDQRRYKFGLKFHIKAEDIFSNENLDDIHEVPLHLHAQGLDNQILKFFKMKAKEPDLNEWKELVKNIKKPKKNHLNIAIVGKYFGSGESVLNDSYHALLHSIHHAGIKINAEINMVGINSEKEEKTMFSKLKDVDGIIVPIGWGSRGIEGKIAAIKYARENKIPYLGLCFGMQLASVEFARNVVGYKDANSEEVNPKSKHKIIHSIPFDPKYQTIKGAGTSMRLGTFDCIIKKGTLSFDIYIKHGYNNFDKDGNLIVQERHRHRFEFNNEFRKPLEDKGFVISGTSPDDFFVEMIELPKKVHPFFVATQAHPEYKSRPLTPHPLFIEFLRASV